MQWVLCLGGSAPAKGALIWFIQKCMENLAQVTSYPKQPSLKPCPESCVEHKGSISSLAPFPPQRVTFYGAILQSWRALGFVLGRLEIAFCCFGLFFCLSGKKELTWLIFNWKLNFYSRNPQNKVWNQHSLDFQWNIYPWKCDNVIGNDNNRKSLASFICMYLGIGFLVFLF